MQKGPERKKTMTQRKHENSRNESGKVHMTGKGRYEPFLPSLVTANIIQEGASGRKNFLSSGIILVYLKHFQLLRLYVMDY
jgi:hypothetical protein